MGIVHAPTDRIENEMKLNIYFYCCSEGLPLQPHVPSTLIYLLSFTIIFFFLRISVHYHHHPHCHAYLSNRVKKRRIFVRPNAGFTIQLRLFHKMGWKIDPQHEKYKVYRMRLAADKVRKGKLIY